MKAFEGAGVGLKKVWSLTQALFFTGFFDNTNKWIWWILQFRKQSLSLGQNSLSLGGKFCSFMGKFAFFALKLRKNCQIFEFRFRICLSLVCLEFSKNR